MNSRDIYNWSKAAVISGAIGITLLVRVDVNSSEEPGFGVPIAEPIRANVVPFDRGFLVDMGGAYSSVDATIANSGSIDRLAEQTNSWSAQVRNTHPALQKFL